jgi:hypothetical protein
MLKIIEPFHGAVLNRRHGEAVDGGLNFWPFLPDHFQRLDTAIRWATEHGYAPVFFHEGLLGGKE